MGPALEELKERKVWIEALLVRVPLPYPIVVAIGGALSWFLGLILYALDGNISKFLLLSQRIEFTGSPSWPQFAFIAGLLLAIPYIRRSFWETVEQISPLLEGGSEVLSKNYRRATSLKLNVSPGIIIMLLWAGFGEVSSEPSRRIFESFYPLVFWLPGTLFLGTVIMFLFFFSLAVAQLPNSPLNLKSFAEDRMLGLRPVGNLMLRISAAYFTLVMLGLTARLLLPSPGQILAISLMAFLMALGVLLFFIPLYRIHRVMVSRKMELTKWVSSQYFKVLGLMAEDKTTDKNILATHAKVKDALQNIHILRGDIAAVNEWPFDTKVIARLLAIILSTTAILLSRVVASIFRF